MGDEEEYEEYEEVVEGEDKMIITVPPGASPGEVILIEVEGKTVEFTLPPDCKEGDEIEMMPEDLQAEQNNNADDDEGQGWGGWNS